MRLCVPVTAPTTIRSLLRNRSHSMSTNPGPIATTFTTIKQTTTTEKEIKKSKFIAIATPITTPQSAQSFLSQIRDPRATHNCWAYKIGDENRSSDDGEPSGTAGKPMQTAISCSGLDRVMVVVIRYFGGVKLGTGGLVRAYGGVVSDCLKGCERVVVKSRVVMGVEVGFDVLGVVYNQLQLCGAEEIKEDYDTGSDGTVMVSFKVDFDQVERLEDGIRSNSRRELVFYKS